MDVTGHALFDSSGHYRYTLTRDWAEGPRVTFVLLNPSRADARHNDPTVCRCLSFARHWGCGGMEVVNLFAYRTANPADLRRATDPVGAENDRHLVEAARRADFVVAGWGNHGVFRGRADEVLALLDDCASLYCFGLTRFGQPRHPLYLRLNTPLIRLESARFAHPAT